MVLATDGEKFFKDLEIVDYMTDKEIFRRHLVLSFQVFDRNNLVEGILVAASYSQQEVHRYVDELPN